MVATIIHTRNRRVNMSTNMKVIVKMGDIIITL